MDGFWGYRAYPSVLPLGSFSDTGPEAVVELASGKFVLVAGIGGLELTVGQLHFD